MFGDKTTTTAQSATPPPPPHTTNFHADCCSISIKCAMCTPLKLSGSRYESMLHENTVRECLAFYFCPSIQQSYCNLCKDSHFQIPHVLPIYTTPCNTVWSEVRQLSTLCDRLALHEAARGCCSTSNRFSGTAMNYGTS